MNTMLVHGCLLGHLGKVHKDNQDMHTGERRELNATPGGIGIGAPPIWPV